MQSQVLNTIQLTRKKQEIITRDEQALAKFQAIKEAKEKARVFKS